MDLKETETKAWLKLLERFYQEFEWLADSNVLNFHVDAHWTKLNSSWRIFLENLEPDELGKWLLDGTMGNSKIWPLGLQAFRKSISVRSLSRRAVDIDNCLANLELPQTQPCDPRLEDLFKLHVKQKKRHEVERIGKLISACAAKVGVNTILDIGSGLGHLSRYLAHVHDLHMTCVDCVETFTASAEKLDAEILSSFKKRRMKQKRNPAHVTLKLEMNKVPMEFTNFGVIGLHTCGNLGPVILNTFANSSEAKFVVSVGCCYMKLDAHGYPLSRFVNNISRLKFKYEALEVSCHAIENFSDQLIRNQHQKLKIHCFRATLEKIIADNFPSFRNSGLKGVKNFESIGFPAYARKAVSELEITFQDSHLENQEVDKMLSDWWKVIIFYSLRLLMATVVETSLLLDRSLFLTENGFSTSLLPIFDGRVSPRNFAIVSIKM